MRAVVDTDNSLVAVPSDFDGSLTRQRLRFTGTKDGRSRSRGATGRAVFNAGGASSHFTYECPPEQHTVQYASPIGELAVKKFRLVFFFLTFNETPPNYAQFAGATKK